MCRLMAHGGQKFYGATRTCIRIAINNVAVLVSLKFSSLSVAIILGARGIGPVAYSFVLSKDSQLFT